MLSGPFKSVFFAALTAMLSVVQCICADASGTVEPPSHQQAEAHSHDAHKGDAAHVRHGQQPSPCDSSQSVCEHCEAAQFYKPSVKPELAGLVAGFPVEKAVKAVEMAPILGPEPNRLSRQHSRWRAPPMSSPVSLKIRLLT